MPWTTSETHFDCHAFFLLRKRDLKKVWYNDSRDGAKALHHYEIGWVWDGGSKVIGQSISFKVVELPVGSALSDQLS